MSYLLNQAKEYAKDIAKMNESFKNLAEILIDSGHARYIIKHVSSGTYDYENDFGDVVVYIRRKYPEANIVIGDFGCQARNYDNYTFLEAYLGFNYMRSGKIVILSNDTIPQLVETLEHIDSYGT